MNYFLVFFLFYYLIGNELNSFTKKDRKYCLKNFVKKNNIKKNRFNIIKKNKHIENKKSILKKKWCGDTYTVKNNHGTFTVCVQNHLNYDEVCLASYYDWGKLTATGEKFCKKNYTAAHPYLPIPCIAEVTCVDNPRKKIIVKINDRGPFTKRSNLLLDLTTKGADILGFRKDGLAKVRIKVLKERTKELVEHGGSFSWDGRLPYLVVRRRYLALQLRRKKFLNFIKRKNQSFKLRLIKNKTNYKSATTNLNKKRKNLILKKYIFSNKKLCKR